jgi:glycosyltransferase 2 family protein
VKGAIAIGLLVWLVATGRLDVSALAQVDTSHALGLGMLLAGLFVQAIRWWMLLHIQGVTLSLRRTVAISWIGQFFAQLLPGGVGDVVRAVFVARDAQDAKLAVTSAVFVDRLLGLYALLLLSLPALYALSQRSELFPDDALFELSIGALLVATTACVAPLVSRTAWRVLRRGVPARLVGPLDRILASYQAHTRWLAASFGASLVASICVLVAFFVAGRIVDPTIEWRQVLLIAPLAFVAGSLPITPGGFGVAEATSSVLFAKFGITSGATIMLLLRLWLLLLRLPGGIAYVVYSGSRVRVEDAQRP